MFEEAFEVFFELMICKIDVGVESSTNVLRLDGSQPVRARKGLGELVSCKLKF